MFKSGTKVVLGTLLAVGALAALPAHAGATLDKIKKAPEVCTIHAATANPLQVLIAETEQGRGIIGVVDGLKSKGIETDADIAERRGFLRKIGYKLA